MRSRQESKNMMPLWLSYRDR